MLTNIKEIKEFMKWCKLHKIKSFKGKDIEFELSELSFIDQPDLTTQLETAQELKETNNLKDNEQIEEDEELLMWSST